MEDVLYIYQEEMLQNLPGHMRWGIRWVCNTRMNAVTGEVAKDKNGAEMGKGYLDNEQEIRQIEWKYEVEKAH